MTEVDASRMLAAQNGKCSICACNLSFERGTEAYCSAAIDHDHTDGRIRGVLCRECNGGIGLLRDDVDLLKRAIAYLEGSLVPPNVRD
jgi:hypothetical protein